MFIEFISLFSRQKQQNHCPNHNVIYQKTLNGKPQPMKIPNILFLLLLASCSPKLSPSAHYQKYGDIASLKAAFRQIPTQADTLTLKHILGEPVDFGFDYRYYSDSVGPKGCPVAAVFWINELGQVTAREIFEVCE